MFVLEYKIKAKKHQQIRIEEAIRTVQFVRNKCLRFWMDSAKKAKVSRFDLSKYSTQLRKEFEFVESLNSMAVQASAERTWFAISRFFDNCKKRVRNFEVSSKCKTHSRQKTVKRKGYPKFQKDNRSIEYKTSGWKLHLTKRRITFTDKIGIGEVKLLGSWDIHTFPVKLIKRVRIVRRADGYYCQFCLDVENKKPLTTTGNQIAIDVGQKFFYADSNGEFEENPRFLKAAAHRIRLKQKSLNRKQKKSANRNKARKQLAKTYLRVSRQREEYAKRLALRLIQSNDLVAHVGAACAERINLNVFGLARGHNAKSVNDVAWGLFFEWLTYFGVKYGRQIIAVNPYNTSQMCSNCGNLVPKTLKERIHICDCGLTLDRDTNAAINILKLATQGHWGSRSADLNAWGESTSTLAGVIWREQVGSLNQESPLPKRR
jgi:putative transposase